MSHSWLQRQRKQALLDLSKEAGLELNEDLRKDEIVETLDEYLPNNKTRLQSNSAFDGYWVTRRGTTPFKTRESTAAFSVVKGRPRRATRVKQESEYVDAISAVTSALSPSGQLSSRTPATRARRISQLPGPPSPATVADIVEEESAHFMERLNDLYTLSGIDDYIANLREACSSVTAIQTTFLIIEAFALQRAVMPWEWRFKTPAFPAAHIPSISVILPDLFVLVTGSYWSKTLLFSATNVILPWILAYFYNLTIRDVKRGNARVSVARYQADPFTFNVVKGLLVWLVYGQGVSFGLINREVAQDVNRYIYGGATAMIVSSVIGATAALYEAAQRRTVA
ncbi:uncharacterized protein MYCFIDRAFT_40008 [Pseudocercospora fijiensis CIRAD86]|uniref:Uncharacterized protein n=1 Tax=Pseudocercospora fijiensis (strain CIRAD86) TaxID=383855 RepID=M3A4B6_PSEFD|nr:uncharacterized protein MYCFIDRAFT_40008 [Pseudocercospora fijiensis CIRAD86]EME85954.1 hypothetical protein MYCFIDRAFT_40008 [Pseudocercospora fijiensis CIRAD86]